VSTRLRGWVFAALYHCGRTLERAATPLFYAAAGTARLAELRAAIQRQWDQAGEWQWDPFTAAGLMPWERELYLRFLKPDDRVLMVGCGTGRDLLALLELGYRAEGLDVGPRCTAIARDVLRERGWHAPVYTGAVETFALPASYDVFVFAWYCYSYIPGSAARIHTLRKLRAHLTAGGRIVATYVPAVRPPRRLLVRLARLAGRLSRSDWRPEYGDVLRLGPPGRGSEHYEHQFAPDEFEAEVRAAGLTVAFHEPGEIGKAVLIDQSG
jgi:SAM-dependent methyltransferase